MDMKADHTMNCKAEGDQIARHNLIRDTLAAIASSAGLAPGREAEGLVPGLNQPADVMVPFWNRGQRHVAFDVTVVNSLQDKYRDRAGPTPGIALEGANQAKNTKFANKITLVFSPWFSRR